MSTHTVRNQRGLTLVEILIVVILLGIIAAVAVPQFSTTTKDARENTLDSNLAALRNAIELYAAQHNGVYPGQIDTDGSTPTGDDPTATAAFIAQLTQYSKVTGETSTTKDPTFPFGPYFRKGIPDNPLPTTSTAVAADYDEVGDIANTGPASGSGWKVAIPTGQIIANDDDYDDR